MTGKIRNLFRKDESESQTRKRKEERETKPKEVESKCKKISQFFPNVNEQVADPRVVSRAGLFGSRSGLKLTKISGLNRA